MLTPPPDPRPDDGAWPTAEWPPPERLAGSVVDLVRGSAVVDDSTFQRGLFAALDDDRCWAYVAGRPGSPEDVGRMLAEAEGAGRWPWVVVLRAPVAGLGEGAIVGTTSFLDVSVADARCEIGWTAYAPAVWGSQVNAEAKLLLLTWAFDAGFGRVQLKTDIRNLRSQQAVDRLGARFEGVLRRYQRRSDGSVRDTVMFSVTAEDWPAVRAGLLARLGRVD